MFGERKVYKLEMPIKSTVGEILNELKEIVGTETIDSLLNTNFYYPMVKRY